MFNCWSGKEMLEILSIKCLPVFVLKKKVLDALRIYIKNLPLISPIKFLISSSCRKRDSLASTGAV